MPRHLLETGADGVYSSRQAGVATSCDGVHGPELQLSGSCTCKLAALRNDTVL